MITALIIVGSILGYVAAGAWTFGYRSAKLAEAWNERQGYDSRDPSWYHDEPDAIFPAIFWPFYFTIALLLGKVISTCSRLGESTAVKGAHKRKIRIELEKKIRVEQERIEREAIEEVEETLRKSRAA